MTRELLIFGAYSALGKGVTSSLLNKNYAKIFLFDRHIAPEPVGGAKVENITLGDLSKEEEVKKAFAHLTPSKEKYFFLFSTIGGFIGGKPIADIAFEEWDKMFDINLKTNFLIAKYFSNLVKNSGGGSVCFTSAITALKQAPNRGAYDSSKSALISMVKTLALEGMGFNLSANAVAPYIIDTPANREWMPDSDFRKWIKPEEIGNLADWIFSNFNIMTGNVVELVNRFEKESY